jgi:RNA polymerase sigma-70 factor (ECF subfamily)
MDTDRALMEAVARGDESAFAALVDRYGPKLLAVAHRLLGSRADAEDAVQRALLHCYLGAAGYRPRWAVSTWIYRILTNACVDELRRRAARPPADMDGDDGSSIPSGADAPPDLDVWRALEKVPREARVLLALRYVDGLSHEELARIRGISVNTVKSQLTRGKTILRELLTKGGGR